MSTIKKEHKVLKITDTLYSISKFLNYEDKSNLLSSSKTIFNKKSSGMIENKNDPIVPDIVLLGLIFDNFLPPMVFPTTYPPISVKKHMLIMYRKKTGPSDLCIT